MSKQKDYSSMRRKTLSKILKALREDPVFSQCSSVSLKNAHLLYSKIKASQQKNEI